MSGGWWVLLAIAAYLGLSTVVWVVLCVRAKPLDPEQSACHLSQLDRWDGVVGDPRHIPDDTR